MRLISSLANNHSCPFTHPWSKVLEDHMHISPRDKAKCFAFLMFAMTYWRNSCPPLSITAILNNWHGIWEHNIDDTPHLKLAIKYFIRSPTLWASGFVPLHGENWKIGDKGLSRVGAVDICRVLLGWTSPKSSPLETTNLKGLLCL